MSTEKRPSIRGEQGIAYYRVSSAGQVNTDYDPEGISLPAQRVASKQRARELGIALVDEYIDPGKSGKTIDQRPAFQEMIARIKADRTIKHVFVYALSRFARNRYDDAIMMMTLERLGVQLHSATEKNLDASPAGQAMHGMIAVFNEYQVRVSGEDIKYKMGQKAMKGGTIGVAPLGYLNVREQFEGREVRTVLLDPERAPLITLAFELYATGKYNFRTLRDALTEAGLRTKPTKRWTARPVSVHKIGELLRDRYYLGFITYNGEEYPGRHEPLVSQELFDQVQRVLYAERRAGTRQRVHNHYLKGLIFCDRCQRRLIILPGRSKSGAQYFYYICRGRQDKSCDLPYLPVAAVEDAIERHYINVQLSDDFCAAVRHRLDAAMASTTDSTRRLRAQYARQLKELNAREDGLLELVGDPDWPKDKLTAKMRAIREERTQIEARLSESDIPLDAGYEVLTTVLRLLEDPQALYRQSSIRARKVLNKAIFTRLYLDAVSAGPVVAADDLNEPFAATVAARRAWSLGEAVDDVLTHREQRVAPARESGASLMGGAASQGVTVTALLSAALVEQCSSKAVMVEVRGLEPLASSVRGRRSTRLSYTPWKQLKLTARRMGVGGRPRWPAGDPSGGRSGRRPSRPGQPEPAATACWAGRRRPVGSPRRGSRRARRRARRPAACSRTTTPPRPSGAARPRGRASRGCARRRGLSPRPVPRRRPRRPPRRRGGPWRERCRRAAGGAPTVPGTPRAPSSRPAAVSARPLGRAGRPRAGRGRHGSGNAGPCRRPRRLSHPREWRCSPGT